MIRLSPTRLWRIHLSVAAAVVATAWAIGLGYALLSPAAGADATLRNLNAFVPAALLTLLMAVATLLLGQTSRQLSSTERTLRREVRRSRKALENMREGVVLLNARGRVTFANGAAQAWLPDARGHRFSSAIARAGFELTNEDGTKLRDNDPIRSFCLQRGCDLDGIWLTRTAGHDDAWLAVSVRVLRDDDDTVTGATLTITDRSEEHERLHESALSASILADMHDAVMIADAQGIVVDVNPAFTHLTGYAREEIVGQSADILRSTQYDAEFHAAFWRQMERDGHWSGRFWNRRKSGEEYCAWQIVTMIRDSRGHTVRHIVVSRDITDQELRENELWQRANFDALTGLANRTRFTDRLHQALSHSLRHGESFALCYLDLDRFKQVNDTLGHAAGDALLREVAARMIAVLREEDTIARLGGDEFALLLPKTQEASDIGHVAQKVIDALAAPFDLIEGEARIGVSIGVARFPQDGTNATALAAAADQALYRVKAGGRNGWRLASA